MLNVILWKCISPILTAHNIGHFRVDPSLEAKCEAYNRRIFFKSHANKSHFCYKGFALSAVLKMRGFGTRKCPDQA